MSIHLHFDDIIYNIQKQGGISRYWQEMTSRVILSEKFCIIRDRNPKFFRYIPVPTSCQIFHSSYYRSPLGRKSKRVVTVHDFLYQHGLVKNPNSFLHIQQMSQSINTADAIICVSESTKRDLLFFFPHLKEFPSINIIPHGSSLSLPPDTINQELDGIDSNIQNILSKHYILVVCKKRAKHKNFESALLAFLNSSLVKLGFSMLCVGSQFSAKEIEHLTYLGLQNNVFALSNLSNFEMSYVYNNAFALVYPSLYEGFGIPPLEAMNLGCPVIASNTSSLPEVVGDAGILVDPRDINSISLALEELLDENVRKNYISKGFERSKLFAWDLTSKKHIELYESLIL
jgi:glycosyltransferase involved in cell wall biosynthesis